jgi:chromate transporter
VPEGQVIGFAAAVRTWMRIGLLSFGGPAGQISVMHRILVDEKRWIGEERFLHALSFCMLLPGPEAQQLATYIGWLLHGTRGGLVAGLLFVLPGFIAILALSFVYVLWEGQPLLDGVFLGLKAAVIALVIDALLRIGRRALRGTAARLIALGALVGIAVLRIPFPAIVLGAGVFGYFMARAGRALATSSAHGAGAAKAGPPPVIDERALTQARPTTGRALRVLAVWLPLWLLPVIACALIAGEDDVFTQLGVFFSKMAVVTFGGAYAVLAYVAQQAVERYAWITPTQMVDGLGLAESTPGPLIMVVQFVGFLAAYQVAGSEYPLLAGVAGALITVWVTFVPCFLWIFLGAPYVEALRGNAALSSALAAITAAVVGVIANLALWFATHVLFDHVSAAGLPSFDSLRILPAILTAIALILMFALKWNLGRTIACCVVLGAATSALPL